MKILIALLLLAHLSDRPDLNSWAMSLKSSQGTPCCESDEAHALNEPDWRVSKDGHYQVFLEDDWRDVPAGSVVQGPNKYGRVLVWFVTYQDQHNHVISVYVRCFLPAAGT